MKLEEEALPYYLTHSTGTVGIQMKEGTVFLTECHYFLWGRLQSTSNTSSSNSNSNTRKTYILKSKPLELTQKVFTKKLISKDKELLDLEETDWITKHWLQAWGISHNTFFFPFMLELSEQAFSF